MTQYRASYQVSMATKQTQEKGKKNKEMINFLRISWPRLKIERQRQKGTPDLSQTLPKERSGSNLEPLLVSEKQKKA